MCRKLTKEPPRARTHDWLDRGRRRTFTAERRIGDVVDVFRTKHGWCNGTLRAKITKLADDKCTVVDIDGTEYEVLHPRDMVKARF